MVTLYNLMGGDECVAQEFIAGDEVDYEDENGEPLGTPTYAHHEVYQPFNMKQPKERR